MNEYKRITIDKHIIDIIKIYDTYVIYFQYDNNYAQTTFYYNEDLNKFVGFDGYIPTQRQLNYIQKHIFKMI